MKNHRDLLGFVVNTLVVVVILAAIVLGLNRIGVYDLPDTIEGIFTKLNEDEKNISGNDGTIYDSLDFNEKDNAEANVAELSYENARILLENIDAKVNYNQELLVEHFSEHSVRTERFIISKRDNNFDVSVYDEKDVLLKTISSKAEYVYITNPLSSIEQDTVVKLPASDFSISDECGFILTHQDFLASDFLLDESTFSVEDGEYGSNLVITFDDAYETHTMTKKYTISLDYGIVTDAECSENGVLVYKMNTVSLHQVN